MDLIQKLNEISERELTKGETAKKEKIVKSMKKDKAGFEKRYGDDAESVMYATATKMAKNEAIGDSADLQKIKTAAGGEEMLVKTMFASATQNGLDEDDFIDSARRMLNMTPDNIKAIIDNDTIKKAMGDSEQPTTEGGMSDIHIGAQEALADYVDDDGKLKMPKRDVVADLVKRSKEASMPLSYELETAAQMVADKFDDDGEEKYMGDNELNTNTMENNDKKDVKEAIQMTADTPEEAGMLMQILKMAGIKPMGAEMPDTKPGDEMDPGELNKQMDTDDAAGSMDMARIRDIVKSPDEEKAEETFANEPEEKTQDVDSLVNVHSGGLNRQKTQYRKEYPGDNQMAVEDKITEEELANSLRTQYESFKQAYQEAAKPDYIDLDKDGNKTEPMKKAAQDKEAKDKK